MKVRSKQTVAERKHSAKDLEERMNRFRISAGTFDYTTRGAAVAKAHGFYTSAFQLRKHDPHNPHLWELHHKAIRLWNESIAAAYPDGFWDEIEQLNQGKAEGLEAAVRFLEADPLFYRTGYVKERLIRRIKSTMLTPAYVTRLQQVVLHVVDTRDDRDFRAFCRLARKADGPELRAGLEARLASLNPGIRRRAGWVIDALKQKDQQEKGRAWKPKT